MNFSNNKLTITLFSLMFCTFVFFSTSALGNANPGTIVIAGADHILQETPVNRFMVLKQRQGYEVVVKKFPKGALTAQTISQWWKQDETKNQSRKGAPVYFFVIGDGSEQWSHRAVPDNSGDSIHSTRLFSSNTANATILGLRTRLNAVSDDTIHFGYLPARSAREFSHYVEKLMVVSAAARESGSPFDRQELILANDRSAAPDTIRDVVIRDNYRTIKPSLQKKVLPGRVCFSEGYMQSSGKSASSALKKSLKDSLIYNAPYWFYLEPKLSDCCG